MDLAPTTSSSGAESDPAPPRCECSGRDIHPTRPRLLVRDPASGQLTAFSSCARCRLALPATQMSPEPSPRAGHSA